MSRTCSKEVMTGIYSDEIESQQLLLDEAAPKVEKAHNDGALTEEAYEVFRKSQEMLKAADAMLLEENFTKSLHFLIRSVANYYLMLGDKGVLRQKEQKQ